MFLLSRALGYSCRLPSASHCCLNPGSNGAPTAGHRARDGSTQSVTDQMRTLICWFEIGLSRRKPIEPKVGEIGSTLASIPFLIFTVRVAGLPKARTCDS
jgi:hypothetical protein